VLSRTLFLRATALEKFDLTFTRCSSLVADDSIATVADRDPHRLNRSRRTLNALCGRWAEANGGSAYQRRRDEKRDERWNEIAEDFPHGATAKIPVKGPGTHNDAMPALLLLLGALQSQQGRFDVFVQGKKAGVATYAVSTRKAGGRITRLRIVLADGSVSESVSESDAGGTPVRAVETVRRGTAQTKETVTYNPKGDATIVRDKAKPFIVRFNANGSRKDPSELWFRTVKPVAGAWAKYFVLDSGKKEWHEVKVKYVGKRGGGHLIQQSRNMGVTTKFTLDDKGFPISFESGELRLVRR
jgi:hypothetical protein